MTFTSEKAPGDNKLLLNLSLLIEITIISSNTSNSSLTGGTKLSSNGARELFAAGEADIHQSTSTRHVVKRQELQIAGPCLHIHY